MQEIIGTGIDCLYSTPAVDGTTDTNFGVAAIAMYKFSDGTLVSSGKTSVGVVSATFGDGPVNFKDNSSPIVNLLTGSIPDADSNSILVGTGKYKGTTGTIRLSGGMYMGDDQVYFNCVWETDLKIPPPPAVEANDGMMGDNNNVMENNGDSTNGVQNGDPTVQNSDLVLGADEDSAAESVKSSSMMLAVTAMSAAFIMMVAP